MAQLDRIDKIKELDKTVEDRIRSLVDGAGQRYLGLGAMYLNSDITDRLKKDSLLSFYVDTKKTFKSAKKQFKKHYLEKVLQIHAGNVSTSAKVAGIDRRSIHRLMTELGIIVDREKLLAENYTGSVQEMITDALQAEGSEIRGQGQDKLMRMYRRVAPNLSREIVRELPSLSLDEAEREFERKFIEKALGENDYNISATARKIGLRFETLHRKMKNLNIS